MAKQKFTDNASSKLASSILATDLALTVTTGDGALFPSLSGSDWFIATLVSSTAREIIKVTARSTDAFTIVRAQEGTTASPFAAGDSVELRLTEGGLEQLLQLGDLDTDGTLAANSDSRVATQKATKTYVDAKVAGLSWKQAVRAATTAAGTLASSFANGSVIDGVTLATGDRILVKNQSTASENGIYVVAASGTPSRSTDADAGGELVNATCYVSEGTANADTQWTCTTNAPITVGTTAINFAQLASGGGGTLDGLSDVVITSPANGDVLTYNSGSSEWVNSASGGGATTSWFGVSLTTPPAVSTLTWVNQGSATGSDVTGGLLLKLPAEAAWNTHLLVKTAPSTPYTFTAMLLIDESTGDNTIGGILARESSTGKFVAMHHQMISGGSNLNVIQWASATSPGTNLSGNIPMAARGFAPLLFLQIADDGTNMSFAISATGEDFSTVLYSAPRTTYLSGGADQIGVFGGVTNSKKMNIKVVHWETA